MRQTEHTFEHVKELAGHGLSDYKIAAIVGLPRATVQRWRHRGTPPNVPTTDPHWTVPDEAAYAYLLGCYLGDGNVSHRPPNGWSLRVACDRQYPRIIEEVLASMAVTFPGATPKQRPASIGASDVLSISHLGVREAFPQHGPGRKHRRPIVLRDWQREITYRNPGALIRGLIHSDGCRVENCFTTKLPSGRVAEYRYVRYFFSNLSADIRNIFAEHCRLLGIRVTQSNPRNLSVAHRHSVAILEELVGPKS